MPPLNDDLSLVIRPSIKESAPGGASFLAHLCQFRLKLAKTGNRSRDAPTQVNLLHDLLSLLMLVIPPRDRQDEARTLVSPLGVKKLPEPLRHRLRDATL